MDIVTGEHLWGSRFKFQPGRRHHRTQHEPAACATIAMVTTTVGTGDNAMGREASLALQVCTSCCEDPGVRHRAGNAIGPTQDLPTQLVVMPHRPNRTPPHHAGGVALRPRPYHDLFSRERQTLSCARRQRHACSRMQSPQFSTTGWHCSVPQDSKTFHRRTSEYVPQPKTVW